MQKTMTQDELDKIADVIWWIYGYRATDTKCRLDDSHTNALAKARYLLVELSEGMTCSFGCGEEPHYGKPCHNKGTEDGE